MAFKVKDDVCVGCGACSAECPMDAIKMEGGRAVINADACIECGACAGTCPTDAIQPE